MKFGIFSNAAFAATALVVGLSANSAALADDDLTVQDGYVTTLIDKSVVEGAIRQCTDPGVTGEKCFAAWQLNEDGYLMFDYSGSVNSVETDQDTAELKEISKQVGTIEGTALFPVEFGMMAGAMYGAMNGGPMPTEIPEVVEWTCAHCDMVVDGKHYTSNGSPETMKMKGRAFTGLGPVEMGQIVPNASLSVRMAGCSAVTGDGKVGTLCLNGTFTFNMSQMMSGIISGTGTSNCITVLHEPMPM